MSADCLELPYINDSVVVVVCGCVCLLQWAEGILSDSAVHSQCQGPSTDQGCHVQPHPAGSGEGWETGPR